MIFKKDLLKCLDALSRDLSGKEILRADALRMTGAAHDKAQPSPLEGYKGNRRTLCESCDPVCQCAEGCFPVEASLKPGKQGVGFFQHTLSRISNIRQCLMLKFYPLTKREGNNNNVTAISRFTSHVSRKRAAFTLAEVLITLGIIGVVAAIVLPPLQQNIQEKIRKEQVRTVKYKLTLATDKMKSLNLIGAYPSTEDFVNELKKHFKIAKVCDSSNLRACWPTDTINTPDGSVEVNSLTNGSKIKALALGTASTSTVGIVTGDGTSMILAYSPVCNALDSAKTYLWSTTDNKPETNATTNCISAIFDINGAKNPNKIGTDVRTLNSLFGSKQYSATAISKDECNALKTKLGINACYYDNDYWAGAVKKCADIGMHLPSMQTLATIAGAKYGRTDIDVYTLIMRNDFTNESYPTSSGNCLDYFKAVASYLLSTSNVICVDTLPNGANSSVASIAGNFWSSSEVSATTAHMRNINSTSSTWYPAHRNNNYVPLCLGD